MPDTPADRAERDAARYEHIAEQQTALGDPAAAACNYAAAAALAQFAARERLNPTEQE